ncbi:unnamed protein product, partial [Urochloa humidicola]
VSLSPASPTDDSIPRILDSAAAAAPRPPHPIRCRRLAHPSCSSPSGPALPLLHPAPCHPSESPHRPHPCCPRQRRAASSFSDSRCLLASHDGSVCAVRRPAVWTAAVSNHNRCSGSLRHRLFPDLIGSSIHGGYSTTSTSYSRHVPFHSPDVSHLGNIQDWPNINMEEFILLVIGSLYFMMKWSYNVTK